MRLFAVAALKHLPPSASSLRLIDWTDGSLGAELPYFRSDLDIARHRPDADLPDESADAILSFAQALDAQTFAIGLGLLRAGGRLIAIDPAGEPDKSYVDRLEAAGYTRILVEAALDDPEIADTPIGVLMRGEKPHTTDDTLARVRVASDRDGQNDFDSYKGKFVHVLIRQTPNKPVWARKPDDEIVWDAVCLPHAPSGEGESVSQAVLVFSSLPKAVAFMQNAVLSGRIAGINKIAKFRAEIARSMWTFPVRLNPDPDALSENTIGFLRIDPAHAEQPDE